MNLEITTAKVNHCEKSYGIAITDPIVGKIVYSGDCRPSDSLVEIGLNASLLIHEATFWDDMLESALEKMHCTVGETIGVARKMKARRLLMTHFSQRYRKHNRVTLHPNDDFIYGNALDLVGFNMNDIDLLNELEALISERYQ